RQERKQAPWWRGSDLIPENEDAFWELPESAKEFKQKFQERLQGFYEALSQLSNHQINPTQPQLLSVGTVNTNQWEEVADQNCRILVCSGEPEGEKPCGLALLHDPSLKLNSNSNYDENLCGSTGKPSPVWVSNLGEYQVITIFGVNKDPRLKFLKHLNKCKKCKRCSQLSQLFPFKSS
ncbi:MAG: type III-B CRISPR module RAMP protein Cmr6, partial [Thermosynechococcus sp.]